MVLREELKNPKEPPTNAKHEPGATEPRFMKTMNAPRISVSVERESSVDSSRVLTLEGDFFRIGSHPSNDVVVTDALVSRFHCSVLRERSGWKLVDNGSLNGTQISGVRVRDADLTGPECVITVGNSQLRISEKDSTGEIAFLDQASFGDLYGTSLEMRRLFALLDRVSQSEANILIEGESGTGKEIVATEIVRRGNRSQAPLVVVDCGAIAPSLIESELFGHVKGSFTGADRDRVGAFEAADGGTVFLDEIGELPLELQPKLLRALEQREIRRVGDTKTKKINVRVIAATNRLLVKEVNQGRFREDLFYRLSVVTVRVPPLRERVEDLTILIGAFLESMNALHARSMFSEDVIKTLATYDWPGNVRELRNYVERSVVMQDPRPTSSLHPSSSEPPPLSGSGTLTCPISIATNFRVAKEEVISLFERRYLSALLEWSEGNISRAARNAQMDRMNLHRLVQRYQLKETRSVKD